MRKRAARACVKLAESGTPFPFQTRSIMCAAVSNQQACQLAYDGKLEELEALLVARPRDARIVDQDQRMPLHWACSSGREKIVDYLLRLEVPIDAKDDALWTPLMIASSAGHLGIVESLLKNSSSAVAMVNEQNEAGQTSLHYAASKGNCNIAEKLISHGADTNVRDRHKATPLHRAASRGHAKLVEILLEHKSHVNATDSNGDTPLHLACESDFGHIAHLLVKTGAQVKLQNNEENCPLDLATPNLAQSLAQAAGLTN
ncbi:26S proteasome non-ATPase regulatory subunit 10-like [Oscarella lobularis]|uniref:26S proteasome non-ATPase regulatory subunit 10-like n=1 Tax=Oscarella lobularis TaxID=121494 RepID=UPI0033140101